MKTKIITLSLLIPMIAFVFITNAQGIIMEKTAKMTIEGGTLYDFSTTININQIISI